MTTTASAPELEARLIEAIQRCGGKQSALEEASGLLAKIEVLAATGRYGALLSNLLDANDKNNFLALVLEATFAYQFESKGLELAYEVSQSPDSATSIDFVRQLPDGLRVYVEMRLLEPPLPFLKSMREKLRRNGFYRLVMGSEEEQTAVVRVQNTILGKVQDHTGKPIKFFAGGDNVINIVAVDVSSQLLRMIDLHDCLLATYGDPAVEEECRRGIFGLFQEPMPEYPKPIQLLGEKYSHIRQILHGVLFLFRVPESAFLSYSLRQFVAWNPLLLDRDRAKTAYTALARGLPEMTG